MESASRIKLGVLSGLRRPSAESPIHIHAVKPWTIHEAKFLNFKTLNDWQVVLSSSSTTKKIRVVYFYYLFFSPMYETGLICRIVR